MIFNSVSEIFYEQREVKYMTAKDELTENPPLP